MGTRGVGGLFGGLRGRGVECLQPIGVIQGKMIPLSSRANDSGRLKLIEVSGSSILNVRLFRKARHRWAKESV